MKVKAPPLKSNMLWLFIRSKRSFCILILIALTTVVIGQNLITNPSAELDPTTNGWTQVTGDWQSASEVTAQDGSYHFFAGSPSSSEPILSELYQDVDVSANAASIDAGTQNFYFEGYIRTIYGDDEGQIIVEYRDAVGSVLESYVTGLQNTTCWKLFLDTRTAPVNTRTIRIRLFSNRLDGGDSDGYIDDLYLGTEPNSESTNLITNHSAECDPTTNGWTQVTGDWQSGSEITAQEGDFHFFAGVADGTAELYQDVDVSAYSSNIDASMQGFEFKGYMNTENDGDQSRIIIEYRDMSGSVLDSYDTSNQVDTDWTEYSDTRNAPVGTRIIRVRLLSTRSSGSDSDGYMDNLSLIPVAALPIDLMSFNVFKTWNETVKVEWKTASEINNEYFTIERSGDGNNWEKLKRIKGAGNSSQLLTYSTIDNNPIVGVSYYRLKQTDFDGKYSYSNIKLIMIDKLSDSKVTIFPNPVSGKLNFNVAVADEYTVEMYNILGSLVAKTAKSTLDVADYDSGSYIVKVKDQNGLELKSEKVVIIK